VSAWQESPTRSNVHARLGKPTSTTRIKADGHSASCEVFNAHDAIVDAWVQFTFCYDHRGQRIPSPEPLEPSEDVVCPPTYGIPPLTRPGKPSTQIRARLVGALGSGPEAVQGVPRGVLDDLVLVV
jgi:hypothetical protein